MSSGNLAFHRRIMTLITIMGKQIMSLIFSMRLLLHMKVNRPFLIVSVKKI